MNNCLIKLYWKLYNKLLESKINLDGGEEIL
jgi:hypothetical protein